LTLRNGSTENVRLYKMVEEWEIRAILYGAEMM